MEMIELLQETMKHSIVKQEVAGVSLLVQKNGEEVCFLKEGMADRENQKKIERNTIFRIYSQTKPVCAVAAMILMERGLLDLYQPVSDLLPGFRSQKICEKGGFRPVKQEIRIYDLLQMTSGIYYPDETDEGGKKTAELFREVESRLYGENPMTTMEFANALGNCPLAFEPGSAWRYGASADVLGAVIEEAAGMSLGAFMKKEIFEPLKMKDTAFWVPEEKQSRLAKIYEPMIKNGERHLTLYEKNHIGINNKMDRIPAYESGGAGLTSTLDDYMRFATMLLNKGTLEEAHILKENTVKYLTSSKLSEKQQKSFEKNVWMPGFSYGKLMSVCKNESQTAMLTRRGEYGWGGWLGTDFINFPKENMTILIGMQMPDAGKITLGRKLRNIILTSV